MPIDLNKVSYPSDKLTLRALRERGTIADQAPALDAVFDAERDYAALAYQAQKECHGFSDENCRRLHAARDALVAGYQRCGLAEGEAAAKLLAREVEQAGAIEAFRETSGRPGYGPAR